MAGRSNDRGVHWWRVGKLAVGIPLSMFVGYWFQPMVANNSNAVNTVVTIFSILAGFLIAVITFIAEPTLRQAQDYAELQLMKRTVRSQIFRQKILFYLYLMTLGAALAMYLTPPAFTGVLWWLQVAFLSLATFVFLASFTLPGALMNIQMQRYEAALDAKRPQVVRDAKEMAAKARQEMSP